MTPEDFSVKHPRWNVFVAARMRGWSYEMIAIAAGVSHQAVHQQLASYEKHFGPIEPLRKIRWAETTFRKSPRIVQKCRHCGGLWWKTIEDKDRKYFCSRKCAKADCGKLSVDQVRLAMEMRVAGSTWTGLKKLFGCSVQAIQHRIWIHLADAGMLTPSVVAQYWYPVGLRRKASTLWLERTTGLRPSTTGTPRSSATIYPGAHPKKVLLRNEDEPA